MVQRHLTTLAVALALAGPAAAQMGNGMMPQPPMNTANARAMARFPQPVRVGDLPGRYVLAPVEAQPVLGYVAGVVRRADGSLGMVIDRGGVFGYLTTPVVVSIDDVALLGEHVGLMDVPREAFRALPRFDPAGTQPLGPDEVIRVGLTAPFH